MNDSKYVDFLGLGDMPEEERNKFLEDVGELVMKAVFRKAWIELDSTKREILTKLLEESDADPENEEKQNAILQFLDTHVEKLREYAKKEIESIEQVYRETKEELESLQ